jgi:hypothetical protein
VRLKIRSATLVLVALSVASVLGKATKWGLLGFFQG